MIQLNILYPKTENATFDWDYYLNIHMPMSIKLQGTALKGVSIVKGIGGIEGVQVAHIAITSMLFESVNSFIDAFTPHAEMLQGDMKNYTNIQPVIQFSDVVLQVGEGEKEGPSYDDPVSF
ncbi:MAG: EthD family reductase [Ferruginibacter sp.]